MKTILLICIAAFTLSGCAGIVAPFVNNPYAGQYSGTFTDSDGRTGTATVNLTNIGNVFTNLADTKNNQSGTLNGSVGTNKVFNGTVTFPSFSQSVSGTFTKASNGDISGTLDGAGGYTFTLQVSPQKQ